MIERFFKEVDKYYWEWYDKGYLKYGIAILIVLVLWLMVKG